MKDKLIRLFNFVQNNKNFRKAAIVLVVCDVLYCNYILLSLESRLTDVEYSEYRIESDVESIESDVKNCISMMEDYKSDMEDFRSELSDIKNMI